MIPLALKRSPYFAKLVQTAVDAEGWWFDRLHNVDTGVKRHPTKLINGSANFPYEPTRPTRIRAILKDLAISDYSRYTFVDIGSGKGRTLLVAAEFPFQAIHGVELQPPLHEQAVQNVTRYQHGPAQCSKIVPLCLNATEYEFPRTPLVLYLFNPFGSEVSQLLMNSLSDSLKAHPRDVIIAMTYPQCAMIADSMPALRLYKNTSSYRIYKRAAE